MPAATTLMYAETAERKDIQSKTAERKAKAAAKAKEKAEEKERPERTKLDGNPVRKDRKMQYKRMQACMHEFIAQGVSSAISGRGSVRQLARQVRA